jgi:hypothetical protein
MNDPDELPNSVGDVGATEAGVVYTLKHPETLQPVVQMIYTAEQAEELGESFLLAASAYRMILEKR